MKKLSELTDDEVIAKLSRLYRINFQRFAYDCLKIRTKSGAIKPFILNAPQKDFVERFYKTMQVKGKARFIILKARQMGFSTLIEAIIYWHTINRVGVKSLVLTHLDSATKELFEMTRRYYEHTPPFFVSKATGENKNELTFKSIDCAIKTATAGSKNVGHGSTIQCLHWSEVSRSRNQADMTAGVMQTVPNADGSMIFLESTANGVGDYFHRTWEDAVRNENEYEPVFYPWTAMPEYVESTDGVTFSIEEREYQKLYDISDEQLAWRQKKIQGFEGTPERKLALFKEQYPITAEEAFQSSGESMLSFDDVQKARKATYEGIGPVIMGVDPARRGKDHTAIVIRQGRRVVKAIRLKIPDTMIIANRCAELINEFNCDAVFVDTIGLGAGVFDRLNQMGYGNLIYEAIASATAEDSNHYVNRRAEMWQRMCEWLQNGADIPDSDHFASDLLLPKCYTNSNDKLALESKDKMPKSPDLGDALAMTFYIRGIKPKNTEHNEEIRSYTTGGGSMLNGNV